MPQDNKKVKKLISTNPAKNYAKLGEVVISSDMEIKKRVELAHQAKRTWKELGATKRIQLLRPFYNEFEKNKEKIALLITREMGKPMAESKEEVIEGLEFVKYEFDHGASYLKDEIACQDTESVSRVIFEPRGVAAVILPWNYPFLMFLWGVIPNLIAGNVVVVKHSEQCPLSGKLMAEIMELGDLPKGVFSEIYGDGVQGKYLISQNIDLIWFTGSSKVGTHLYEIAGQKFIKAILEMGGSSPALVFEDADLNSAAEGVYKKRFYNCGQICNAAKRLIVHESIFKSMVDKIKHVIESKIVGDPEDEKTDIGSLVSKKQLEVLVSQVEDAVSRGAQVVVGGKVPESLKGVYYLPTLLTNITPEMKVWSEEVFGPVLSIVPFKTEEEAIALANDTRFGLGAYIYTQDAERARRVASRIEAGMIKINQGESSEPCCPFGGYKLSGMGREHGKYGYYELCQTKAVVEKKFK